MPDTTPLLASLLMAGRQEENPFQVQRKYGRQLIVQGSSGEPLKSGNPLEGLARMLTAGVGGYFAGEATRDEDAQNAHNLNVYSEAAKTALSNPNKAADILKGLKGGSAQQEALFGQIIQNSINQGFAQQQAGTTLDRGGYGVGGPQAPNGGLGITVTPNPQSSAAPAGPSANNVGNIGPGKQYATPQEGAADLAQLLRSYPVQYNNGQPMTLRQIARIYAPADDGKNPALRGNNPDQWAMNVGSRGGIHPDTPLDFDNPAVLTRVVQGINPAEKAPNEVQPPEVLRQGVAAGMDAGVSQPQGQQPQAAPQPAPGPPGVQVAQAGPAQPQMPTTSPAGEQLRQQARVAQQNGDNVSALALAKKAQEMDAEYVNRAGLQGQQQSLQQPNQNITNEAKLRDDYRQEPVVKAYREVVPIMESVKTAVERPTRAADLNLVYGLGKIMDPNSVVREGELIMAKNTGTLGDWLAGQYGKLNGGAELQPETRARIVQEMQSRFNGLEASHNSITEAYRGITQRSGLNPENVVIPIRPSGATAPSAAPAAPTQGPTRIDLNGNPL